MLSVNYVELDFFYFNQQKQQWTLVQLTLFDTIGFKSEGTFFCLLKNQTNMMVVFVINIMTNLIVSKITFLFKIN